MQILSNFQSSAGWIWINIGPIAYGHLKHCLMIISPLLDHQVQIQVHILGINLTSKPRRSKRTVAKHPFQKCFSLILILLMSTVCVYNSSSNSNIIVIL